MRTGPKAGLQANGVQMAAGGYAQLMEGSRRYYNIIGAGQQPRGAGWQMRCWSYALAFTPSAAPEGAYMAHAMDSTGAWGAATTNPRVVLGTFWTGEDERGDIQQYQQNIAGMALAMEAWRGDRPDLVTMAKRKANFDVGLAAATTFGLQNGGIPLKAKKADGTHPTIAELLVLSDNQGSYYKPYVGGAGPCPAAGFYSVDASGNRDTLFNAYSIFQATTYASVAQAPLALYASAGPTSANGDGAAAAYADLNRRLVAAPSTGVNFSGPNYQNGNRQSFFPAFAIVAAS